MVNAKKKKDSNSLVLAGIIVLVVLSLSVLVNVVQNPPVTGMGVGDESEGGAGVKKALQEGLGVVLSFFTGIEDNFVMNFVLLIVFVMLCFAFRDIFAFSGWFGDTTEWVLAIGLALIFAMAGTLRGLGVWVFRAVSTFGAITVGVSLFAMFIIFLVVHIWFSKIFLWYKTEQSRQKAIVHAGKVADAWEGLKAFGKRMTK